MICFRCRVVNTLQKVLTNNNIIIIIIAIIIINTQKLQKFTDLKEKLKIIWQLERAYIIPLLLSRARIIPNK